jgi:hypothetical protein
MADNETTASSTPFISNATNPIMTSSVLAHLLDAKLKPYLISILVIVVILMIALIIHEYLSARRSKRQSTLIDHIRFEQHRASV